MSEIRYMTAETAGEDAVRLAAARQQIAADNAYLPTWDELTDDERAQPTVAAGWWLEAAKDAGLVSRQSAWPPAALVASLRLASPSAVVDPEECTAAGFPVLLLPISPRVGIVQDDVDQVAAWARSAAREAKQRCEQCGRVGTRGFTAWPEATRTLADGTVQTIPPIKTCTNKAACRKRWPKPARDED